MANNISLHICSSTHAHKFLMQSETTLKAINFITGHIMNTLIVGVMSTEKIYCGSNGSCGIRSSVFDKDVQ